jgi:5'-3' exonuclease
MPKLTGIGKKELKSLIRKYPFLDELIEDSIEALYLKHFDNSVLDQPTYSHSESDQKREAEEIFYAIEGENIHDLSQFPDATVKLALFKLRLIPNYLVKTRKETLRYREKELSTLEITIYQI